MAYNEELAERVRAVLLARGTLEERRMFGGLTFLVSGAMCCGVIKDDLVVRVGPDSYDEALARPHARPMDFTGRPLRGLVYVGPEGYRSERDLAAWVLGGVEYALSTNHGVG